MFDFSFVRLRRSVCRFRLEQLVAALRGSVTAAVFGDSGEYGEIMTWNTMPVQQVCDVVDFFDALDWPLERARAQRLAVEHFAWTIETGSGRDFLVNSVSGLNRSGVRISQARRTVSAIGFFATDVPDPSAPLEPTEVGDYFALLVREGATRWGAPASERNEERETASWDCTGGGHVQFTLSLGSVDIRYQTPQGAERSRKAARLGI